MRGARLGQHFLTAPSVAKKLIDALKLTEGDSVLEIGPGKGALTKELVGRGARVIAVEKDPSLIALLQETFAREIADERLKLVEDDIRNVLPARLGLTAGSYVLAANIPYYITGEIFRQFLTTEAQPRAIALLVQKEVAERICARTGKESILSLSVKAFGTASIVTKVPAGCFSPLPSVDSAILLIENISCDFFNDIHEDVFFTLVRAGFASKRKLLTNNLKGLFNSTPEALHICGIPPKARAEDVSLKQWKCLTEQLQ